MPVHVRVASAIIVLAWLKEEPEDETRKNLIDYLHGPFSDLSLWYSSDGL